MNFLTTILILLYVAALETREILKTLATSPDLEEAVEEDAEGHDSVYKLLGLIILDSESVPTRRNEEPIEIQFRSQNHKKKQHHHMSSKKQKESKESKELEQYSTLERQNYLEESKETRHDKSSKENYHLKELKESKETRHDKYSKGNYESEELKEFKEISHVKSSKGNYQSKELKESKETRHDKSSKGNYQSEELKEFKDFKPEHPEEPKELSLKETMKEGVPNTALRQGTQTENSKLRALKSGCLSESDINTEKCIRACNRAQEDVCDRLACSQRAKDCLKKECSLNCKKVFDPKVCYRRVMSEFAL